MMIVYKVVRKIEDKFFSAIVSDDNLPYWHYCKNIEYQIGKTVVCPEGRPIMAFDAYIYAVGFLSELCHEYCKIDNYVNFAVFKCEAKLCQDQIPFLLPWGHKSLPTKRSFLDFLKGDPWTGTPPTGTVACSSLKLIESI